MEGIILASDSLLEGQADDPWVCKGAWEEGWQLRIVREGGTLKIKITLRTVQMMRGHETLVISGGSNNMMWAKNWEKNEGIWEVGVTEGIEWLTEIVEEVVEVNSY